MSTDDRKRPRGDGTHRPGAAPTGSSGAAPTGSAGGPPTGRGGTDGGPRPHDPVETADARPGGPLAAWRRTYGASPLHLLLHLAGIALIAWALSQSFDARYSAAYLNLAIWMVGGALLNDLVALPLYVGADRLARGTWGAVRERLPGARETTCPTPRTERHVSSSGRASMAAFDSSVDAVGAPDAARRRAPLVPGNGHVRVPVAMSAVLLLVYFPNIAGKAPIGHRLSTGLPEQPDFAARWLAVTAGLLLASAALYALRLALARRRARAAG